MPSRKIRHTKKATLARVAKEQRALARVVRRIGTAGLARPIPHFGARARIRRERWTGKDALAHIVEWERQALRALRGEPADPELRGLPIDRKNRLLYQRWHHRAPRDVMAYARSVHRDVLAALRALPEASFTKTPRSPHSPNDLVGHPAGHRQRHLEALLAENA